MKKYLLMLLCLLNGLSIFAQAMKTYTDPENVYSMEYAEDWKMKEDKFGKSKMISFDSPRTDENSRKGDAMLALSVQPLDKGINNLDGVMKTQLGSLKKEMGVKTFVENKRVNGKQILVFNMQGGKEVLKTKMVLWVHKGQLYNMMYAAPLKHYATYQSVAETMINSFKFL